MITVVSLNPSIDKSVTIGCFKYGSMNRARDTRLDAGGKGINLAYVGDVLGLDIRLVGFTREAGNDIILKRLGNIKSEFIKLPGAIRTNMKLLDQSTGVVTEINEPGPPVDDNDLDRVRDMILSYATKAEFLVLTGSLPPGCPTSFYADIIQRASCKCVLDAEGESLKLGIEQRPYMIKPNRMELETLVGRELKGLCDIQSAALGLIAKGVSVVAVSLGAEGALLTDGKATFLAPAVNVEVKSTVGAGDSMVAGLISGLTCGLTLDETLRRSVACAAASISRAGTQLMDVKTYEAMLGKITVERMRANG